MARRRTAQVRESIEELEQLRDYYQGTPNAPLMQLLLLLREDQSRTIAECAEKCGISARKAERVWKRYREGGMSGVLNAARCADLNFLSPPEIRLRPFLSSIALRLATRPVQTDAGWSLVESAIERISLE